MATPEELEKKELLAQALSQFGGSGAQSAPAAPQRDVRAERLAAEQSLPAPIPFSTAEAPVAPVQPIPGSRELLIQQQQAAKANLLKQQELAERQSKSITNRPRTKFLKEGQSFAEAFSEPSEAQRAFAFNAGLALLSSSGTNNLSQRIGQALGSGMQGMQSVRQAELDGIQKANESEMKLLQMKQQGISQDMGFTKEIAAMDSAAREAQTANDRYKAELVAKKAQVDYNRTRDDILDNRYTTDTSYNRGRDITADRLASEALTRELEAYEISQDPTSFANLSDIGQLTVQINDPNLDPGTKSVLEKELYDIQNKPAEINKIITNRDGARNYRVEASNLPDDDPNKEFLLQNADLLEANANRLAYGSAGMTTQIGKDGEVIITQGGPANKGGQVGKSDFYDSQTVANLTTVNARAAVDVIRNPDFAASSGRFAPVAEMFSIGLSDSERAAQTSAEKINSQLLLLMAPYLKPMSDVDLKEAKKGMKIPNNLEPEYQMQWLVTQFPKLAMANLDVAAINTGDAPQRKMDFGSGMALSLIKPSYNYKTRNTEFMVNVPTPDQRGRVVNNSVKDVLENFFPRASEAETFKGQGYTLLKGYNRVIPTNVKQQMIKNLMAQSKIQATFQDAEEVFNKLYSAEEFK
jgi:hypothetical protein